MFISTLLLIPWIVFGFKNSDKRFLGLNQTKKSVLVLLVVEIAFFLTLFLLLDKPDLNVAGQGSFAWMYYLFYEKGIFSCFGLAELIDGNLGDKIDTHYQFLYLLTALLMDYIILFLISPTLFRFKQHATHWS